MIMKSSKSVRSFAAMLLSAGAVLFLAHCNFGAPEPVADASFPLSIQGTTVVITPDAGKSDLATELKIATEVEPSLVTAERIQFDFVAAQDAGPMTLLIDWDGEGRISEVVLDAFTEEQNPVARDLKMWLVLQHGQPEMTEGSLLWKHGGWEFRFTDGGDGEDSVYGFRITRI